MKFRIFTLAAVIAASFASVASAQTETRAQYTFKGDLFVWPYVVIVWNNQGTASQADDVVLQDVFITITNDDCNPHSFRMQFVDGMDCVDFDRQIQLTQNNPVYFSAYNGQGGGLSGDPNGSVPSFRGINTIGDPADPLNPNIRFVGGYIVGWTVDANGVPVGSNQLFAGATVVDYRIESAWEYKAWCYRSLWTPPGGIPCGVASPVKPGAPNVLLLNGTTEYQSTPSVLLLDFFATGSPAFGPSAIAPIVASTSDFELTLLTAKFHFEAQPDFDNNGVYQLPNDDDDCVLDSEPAIGGVDVLSFNEDEQPVSETVHCVQCWDSTLGSLYGFQGEESPFALALLGTDKGYARIRGVLDARCDRAGLPNGNPPVRCIQSQDLPLLGIAHKIIRWGAGNDRVTKAASHLTATGARVDGVVFTNAPQGQPPTSFLPTGAPATGIGGTAGVSNRK